MALIRLTGIWSFKKAGNDTVERSDAVFLPGGSHPEPPEYAARLYQAGYAKWIIPSGGVSVKRDKWPGVRSKAEIYDGDIRKDNWYKTEVRIDRVLGELTRCGNQFAVDMKKYLNVKRG